MSNAPPVAALRHGARNSTEASHSGSWRASSRPVELGPARLRALHARDLRRRLPPDPARPDRRGGDDQVRLPLHDRAGGGAGCGGSTAAAMVLKALGAVLAAVVLAIIAPFADSMFERRTCCDAVPARRAAPARRTSPRRSPAPRSCSPAATTSAAASSLLTQLLAAAGIAIGAHFGVNEAVIGLVLGQSPARVACRLDRGVPGLPALPARTAGAARRGPARDRPVRRPLERRLGHRLAARQRSCRSCSGARSSRRRRTGRLLPGRPVAADRADRP